MPMGPQIVPATGFSVPFQISEEHIFVFDSIVIGSEVTGYRRGLHSLSTQRAQRLDEVQHEVGPLDILYKDIKYKVQRIAVARKRWVFAKAGLVFGPWQQHYCRPSAIIS